MLAPGAEGPAALFLVLDANTSRSSRTPQLSIVPIIGDGRVVRAGGALDMADLELQASGKKGAALLSSFARFASSGSRQKEFHCAWQICREPRDWTFKSRKEGSQ